MSKQDSPVQTQSPIGFFKNLLSWKFDGSSRHPTGKRRVLVQTDTGCVLGMELDRSDNVHTVKRKLQVALNVPTDETSLSFGDVMLKDDLDGIRNDSPLLLSRSNMHRSSSTPCLSPQGIDLEVKDTSSLMEVLGNSDRLVGANQMVIDIVKAIKNGVEPLPVHNGLGGAYYFRNVQGEFVAIVKPTDEEPFAPNNPKGFVGRALGQPGLKNSVRVGETGIREVVAYLLDHEHFAGVPFTALVKIAHSIFNVNDGVGGNKKPQKKIVVSKIASCQQFVAHDFDASDYGTSSFPVSSVHRIGILDIRIFNTDRHAGNVLIRKLDGVGRFGQVDLIPIDHGLCLPESLEDPYFEWIHWPQASIPFSEEELEYIEKLDPSEDCEMLRSELPMIREASLRVLVLCTVFLREAASFGLCLAEIGEMMSREFWSGEEEPSKLELVCLEARLFVAERELFTKPKAETDDTFQFDIDCDELKPCFDDVFITSTSFGTNGRNPFSKLESLEEEEEGEGFKPPPLPEKFAPNISKTSMSLTNTYLGDKKLKFPNIDYSSLSHKSANEQLPASANFVKIADMNEKEWSVFLDKFQELIRQTFAQRKSDPVYQRQRQKLGTSCKF